MSSIYGNMGSVLLEKNDLPAAEIAFDKAIELKEDLKDQMGLVELYGHRGNVLLMQNKLEQAEKTMKKALKLLKLLN